MTWIRTSVGVVPIETGRKQNPWLQTNKRRVLFEE